MGPKLWFLGKDRPTYGMDSSTASALDSLPLYTGQPKGLMKFRSRTWQLCNLVLVMSLLDFARPLKMVHVGQLS
jgi:hypothetical protein